MNRDTLLTRADAYSTRRYGVRVSARTLRDWVNEGLVPGPIARGRGQGAGKGQEWSAVAYRRVLQVCRLKARGVTRHAAVLVALWFAGAQLPVERVRVALVEEHRRLRKGATRTLPVGWDYTLTPIPPTTRQRDAVLRSLGDAPILAHDATLEVVASMFSGEDTVRDSAAFDGLLFSLFGIDGTLLQALLAATSTDNVAGHPHEMRGILADPEETERNAETLLCTVNDAMLLQTRNRIQLFEWLVRVFGPRTMELFGISFAPFTVLVDTSDATKTYVRRLQLLLQYLNRPLLASAELPMFDVAARLDLKRQFHHALATHDANAWNTGEGKVNA